MGKVGERTRAKRVRASVETAIVAVALAALTFAGLGTTFLALTQQRLIDRIFYPTGATDKRIVVIGVDDGAEKRFGDWPWPRTLQAKLIERIAAAKPAVIALDIFYSSGKPGDDELGRAIADARNVVLAGLAPKLRRTGNAYAIDDAARPVDAVAYGAADVGHVNVLPDPRDGIVRTVPLTLVQTNGATGSGGHFLPSLGLAAYQVLNGTPPGVIDTRGIRTIGSDALEISWSRGLASREAEDPYWSATDILDGNVDQASLRGKVVFVGATSPSIEPFQHVPIERAQGMPGVYVHANVLNTLLTGAYRAPVARAETAATVLLVALLVGFATRRRLWLAPIAVVAIAGGEMLIGDARFEAGAVMNLAYPLVTMPLAFTSALGLRFLDERRERVRTERDLATLKVSTVPDLEEVHRLANTAELKDDDTGLHIVRVGGYSQCLALAAGWSATDAEQLFHAAKLHDIGKIGVKDAVLLKPGKLDDDDWVIMRSHPEKGGQLLADSENPLIRLASEIAWAHHEKWDGNGYPRKLSGTAIPIAARVTAIADVFDALTAKRPYKEPWDLDRAREEILRCGGSHFDPELAALFGEIFAQIVALKDEYAKREATSA